MMPMLSGSTVGQLKCLLLTGKRKSSVLSRLLARYSPCIMLILKFFHSSPDKKFRSKLIGYSCILTVAGFRTYSELRTCFGRKHNIFLLTARTESREMPWRNCWRWKRQLIAEMLV
jgi:hypothetical protein